MALARDVGLRALAITDHDTFDALDAAAQVAATAEVELVRGCEISTRIASGTVHVLAYECNEHDGDLTSFLRGVRDARDRRNEALVARLAELGVPVSMGAVEAEATGKIVARPHFARALVAAGHAETTRDAFERYLRDRGPAYIEAKTPPPEEAIEIVAAAGGAAVLAHPRQLKLGTMSRYRRFLRRWKGIGLVGVEAWHPSHDATYKQAFADMAVELDLVATGGSDYHGEAKPGIRLGEGDGTIDVRYDTLVRLRERKR